MARFDLNLLSALNALLAEKNVTRAAERLNVTQPTMSGMLQRLRYQFDDDLLIRNRRELELTPFGASLVQPVREALRGVELLIHTEPFFDPATSTREFSLMASNYCTSIFLPQVVARVSAIAPNVRLTIQPIDNPIERIFAGQVDLCITADDMSLFNTPNGSEKVRTQTLFSDRFVCVVAKDHLLTERSSLDDVFAYPHVGVQMFGTVNTIESAWIEQHRPGYKPSAIVADFPLVAPLVAHTRFVGVMPSRMADMSARAMPIKAFVPPYAMPALVEALMWHCRHERDPAHLWLRGLVRDVAANWTADTETPGSTVVGSERMRSRRHAVMHSIR